MLNKNEISENKEIFTNKFVSNNNNSLNKNKSDNANESQIENNYDTFDRVTNLINRMISENKRIKSEMETLS